MYTNIDEMYHAAIRILENRSEQLGDDELMHYGRKGMKWHEDIFSKDDNSQKKASGGNWGNNAFTNAVNDPKYNPIKKAQLEKKKQELLTRPVRIERGVQPRGDQNTSQDMSGYDRALGEGKKVFMGTGYNQYGRPVEDRYLQKAEFEPGTVYANYKYDNIIEPHMSPGQRADKQAAVNKYSQEYGSNNSTFTDEDRKRGQEVRKQQAEERYNKNKAARMDEYEAIKPIKEGKTDTVLVGEDDALPVHQRGVQGPQRFFNPLADIAGVKDPFYTAQASEITPYTDAYRDASFKYKDANGVRKDNLEKQKLRQTQNEQIAKYGNQQPEKNDEQRIAEKARGQFIREEQAAQRKAELDKKKQELLNKAKAEKEARELGEKKNAMLANVRGGSKSNQGSGYNGSDVPGRAVVEGKSGSNYWLGNGSFNGDDALEYEYATNNTGYTRRHKK